MQDSANSPPRKRVRLDPRIRSLQIRQAALAEFSLHGFAASRMEDIARRASLSKGGVYAHYASKDEIFEALLVDVLTPPIKLQNGRLAEDGDLRANVDAFVDHVYDKLAEPDVVAVVRLMIAESGRVPT